MLQARYPCQRGRQNRQTQVYRGVYRQYSKGYIQYPSSQQPQETKDLATELRDSRLRDPPTSYKLVMLLLDAEFLLIIVIMV